MRGAAPGSADARGFRLGARLRAGGPAGRAADEKRSRVDRAPGGAGRLRPDRGPPRPADSGEPAPGAARRGRPRARARGGAGLSRRAELRRDAGGGRRGAGDAPDRQVVVGRDGRAALAPGRPRADAWRRDPELPGVARRAGRARAPRRRAPGARGSRARRGGGAGARRRRAGRGLARRRRRGALATGARGGRRLAGLLALPRGGRGGRDARAPRRAARERRRLLLAPPTGRTAAAASRERRPRVDRHLARRRPGRRARARPAGGGRAELHGRLRAFELDAAFARRAAPLSLVPRPRSAAQRGDCGVRLSRGTPVPWVDDARGGVPRRRLRDPRVDRGGISIRNSASPAASTTTASSPR